MKTIKIGIAGAGTMSSSMALIFMEQGFDTVLHVRSEASMQRVHGNQPGRQALGRDADL